jgi:uncharacterized membrane protein YhhN
MIWIPVPLAIVTVGLTIWADINHKLRWVKLFKPASTLLVILACLLSVTRPEGNWEPSYTALITTGLVFSLAGDVLLIYQDNPKAFMAGLVAFLCAHVAYIVAFVNLQASLDLGVNGLVEGGAALLLLVLGGLVYAYLLPGLGGMRLPVLAYVAGVYRGAATQPFLMVAGALLFYLSDAILATNKFRQPIPYYRLWNLSTYYGGQLLLALSASFLV